MDAFQDYLFRALRCSHILTDVAARGAPVRKNAGCSCWCRPGPLFGPELWVQALLCIDTRTAGGAGAPCEFADALRAVFKNLREVEGGAELLSTSADLHAEDRLLLCACGSVTPAKEVSGECMFRVHATELQVRKACHLHCFARALCRALACHKALFVFGISCGALTSICLPGSDRGC